MQCRDVWPSSVYFIFILFLPLRARGVKKTKNGRTRSRILALSCPLSWTRDDDGHRGDYIDLLITRFSLALGRHVKITFTAGGVPDPWPRLAAPYRSCRWHDQFFVRTRSEHSFSCVANISALLSSRPIPLWSVARRTKACPRACGQLPLSLTLLLLPSCCRRDRDDRFYIFYWKRGMENSWLIN